MNFDNLASDYARLWRTMKVNDTGPGAWAETAARQIMGHRDRYQAVAAATGVPWTFIGVVHMLECGCDFGKHLHNGDPLTARTHGVPNGRPVSGRPPFAWVESAVDALQLKKLDRVTDWSLERLAYELERYNGFGYRRVTPPIPSPYLWSGSTHYERGKFVKDHKFDRTAVSKQIGGMVLLKRLAEAGADIPAPGEATAPPPLPERPPDAEAAPPKADPDPVRTTLTRSTTIRGLVASAAGVVMTAVDHVVDFVSDAAAWIGSLTDAIGPAAKVMKADMIWAKPAVLPAVVLIAIAYTASRRIAATKEGKIG